MNATNILLRHNYVSIPSLRTSKAAGVEALATVMVNLAYYGYALSVESYKALTHFGAVELADWWMDVEKELKDITGANRKIGDFVVYKNFPAEVLDKTLAEYWIPQIMMYWGFPKEMFTEEVKPREKMSEQKRAIVLKLSNNDSLKNIFDSLLKAPARWKDQELEEVLFLSESLPVNLAKMAFKENLVSLASFMMMNGKKIKVSTATDVLRLAAGLSDGDVALREKFKFKSFKKPVRRYLLSMLEECSNLTEDVARRPELFKRLLHQLHPGSHKRSYPHVFQVNDDLYHDRLETFNSKVEALLLKKSPKVLPLLADRPGDFRRRLVHTLDLFGAKAVKAFVDSDVLGKLTTAQVVSLRSHLESVGQRQYRTFPPKGNWTKLQLAPVRPVEQKHVNTLSKALGKELSKRLPKVKVLDPDTNLITLPSNDGEVSPYNRGTIFPIPDDVEFIRTASYWKNSNGQTVWFDNGWNFFDENWKVMGACCWTEVKFPQENWRSTTPTHHVAAFFSGDPVNSMEMEGRAAQLIDLYPAELLAAGVRYAVWNVLCFSRIPFSKADEVFAALQWGRDPQKGNLFEPSRCQLQFPLKGDSLTKYVCVIDLHARQMIYIDANLHGSVSTAAANGETLEKNMPAFMEYIKSLPTVHDLFRESVSKDGKIHVLYSDKNSKLKNVQAYVFKPENKNSKYKSVDLNNLLT